MPLAINTVSLIEHDIVDWIQYPFDPIFRDGSNLMNRLQACTPETGGQSLLNTLGGCGTASTYSATIDVAAYQGINVASDKTLVGLGTNTILNGKGLRMAGVSNIIIQNIKITNLNPKYVWGGDAISMSNTNNIWIDHVTTSSLGRQHYSLGQSPNLAVTISNSYIDGKTSYSATCDSHTYWGLELVGTNDAITFYSTSDDLPNLHPAFSASRKHLLTHSQKTTYPTPRAAPQPSAAAPSSTPSTASGPPTAATPSKAAPPKADSSKAAPSSASEPS